MPRIKGWALALGSLLVVACASHGLPQKQQAQAESRMRAAEAFNARSLDPSSRYMSYADRNIADAQALAARGDRLHAGNKLSRAAADAEAAWAHADRESVRNQLEKARQQ